MLRRRDKALVWIFLPQAVEDAHLGRDDKSLGRRVRTCLIILPVESSAVLEGKPPPPPRTSRRCCSRTPGESTALRRDALGKLLNVVGVDAACTWHSPIQMCILRPVIFST